MSSATKCHDQALCCLRSEFSIKLYQGRKVRPNNSQVGSKLIQLVRLGVNVTDLVKYQRLSGLRISKYEHSDMHLGEVK